MTDFSNFCRGRLPHNATRLAAVEPHVMAAIAPPPDVCAPPPGFVVEKGYNITLSTCVSVGLLNAARLWCIKHHGFDPAYDVQCVLDFYAAVAGCAPTVEAIAATDGLVVLDALEYATTNGYRVNSQNLLMPTFRRIDAANMDAIKRVIVDCGSAFSGVDLYEVDMDGPWINPVSGATIGGHLAPIIGYTADGMTDATWGLEQPSSNPWLPPRVQEIYEVRWTMATT